jgi:hypothetical protein
MEVSEKRNELREREEAAWKEFYSLKRELSNRVFADKELKSKCDSAYSIWSGIAFELVELEQNKNQ